MKKRIISAILTLIMIFSSLVITVAAEDETEAAETTEATETAETAEAAEEKDPGKAADPNDPYLSKVNEEGDPLYNYLLSPYYTAEDKLADMKMVKEQNGFQLWYEYFTGEVAIVDTRTGQITFTNPYDVASNYQSISDAVKKKLLSQLIITFLENGVQKTFYSYTEAALRGQITMKNIKNGIRVEYILGEEATTRLVPRLIEVSRFEELILNNIDSAWEHDKVSSFYELKDKNDPSLTERGVLEMQAKFPITQTMAVYVCSPDINARELRELEGYIKNFCPNYSYEDLEYDHEMTNYEGDDAAPPRFRMALEYTLSDTGLDVRLPANGIEFDESAYQFQTVTVLPYFGCGSNKNNGALVIPDGSGALIRFEDVKGKAVNISGLLYGSDYAYHGISGQHAESMRMPYYGIVTNVDEVVDYPVWKVDAEGKRTKQYDSRGDLITTPISFKEDKGFLAVITEGDSLASLMAECGGPLHPYNTVYAMFTPRPSDEYNLSDSISVSGSATWTVTSKRKYTDSYRIHYTFLSDDELAEENGVEDYYKADWTGMATAYRDYLIEKGDIKKLENTDENLPLFIETFGSVETTERVASFPVTVDKPLTTFEDIKTMYTELSEDGLTNVNFKLNGYANGGMKATVPYKLRWDNAVGGGDGFRDLAAYAEENGFEIYPDFDFAYIHGDELFDGVSLKNHAVRTIDNRYTTKRSYDAATQMFDRSMAVAIAPAAYEYLYRHFGPIYQKYGNKSISVSTLGTDLNSDFDEDEPYHREDNKEFTVELLENLSNDCENIMVDGGNAYTIPYADVIINTALTSSKYMKASESIPFLGMVYHGSKVFTGSATNMEGDINESILNAIENGASLYFILSYQNTSELKESMSLSKYYSVSYDIWKEDMIDYYNKLNDATKDLQTSYIVDHEFLDGERIPDEDEAEADRIAAELEAEAIAEEARRAQEKIDKAARLEARRKAQGFYTEEELADLEAQELLAEEMEETEAEEAEESEEEEEVPFNKYATTSGSIVRVEYEGGVNFILNYNSFDVTVEYDGTVYTVDALDYVRFE